MIIKVQPFLILNIPEIYQNLIQACWDYSPEKRPTFKQIVDDLQTNDSFILETIERDEYENYIEFIESTKSSFNQNGLTQYGRNKPINYDDFIKKAKRRSTIKSVIIKFDDNQKIRKRSATVFGKPNIENSKEQIMNENNNKDTEKHKKHKSKHLFKKHKKNSSDTESNENRIYILDHYLKIENDYYKVFLGELKKNYSKCMITTFKKENTGHIKDISRAEIDSYNSNNVKYIASITHPSIAKFIGYREKSNRPVMLTEYFEFEILSNYIHRSNIPFAKKKQL